MAKKERIRESLTGLPTLEYLMQRIEMGWRPSAIEWERDIVPAGWLRVPPKRRSSPWRWT
jgi:hypothetical protein